MFSLVGNAFGPSASEHEIIHLGRFTRVCMCRGSFFFTKTVVQTIDKNKDSQRWLVIDSTAPIFQFAVYSVGLRLRALGSSISTPINRSYETPRLFV